MQADELNCPASIAGGFMTLDNGCQIDLAIIQRALEIIVDAGAGLHTLPAALEICGHAARTALKQFDDL